MYAYYTRVKYPEGLAACVTSSGIDCYSSKLNYGK